MASFLEGSLAKTIHTAMKSTIMYDVTLLVQTEVDDGAGGFTTSQSSEAFKGCVLEYSDFYKMQGLVPDGMRKAILLQESNPDVTPRLEDRITTTKGPNAGQTFVIKGVDQDPAGATWELDCLPWNEG